MILLCCLVLNATGISKILGETIAFFLQIFFSNNHRGDPYVFLEKIVFQNPRDDPCFFILVKIFSPKIRGGYLEANRRIDKNEQTPKISILINKLNCKYLY